MCAAIKSAPRQDSYLTHTENCALNTLHSYNDIIIVPADKGCATVVINREDYESKALEHFNDLRTYFPMNIDPTYELKNNINKY